MLFDRPEVERMLEAFRRLPGVGKRSAERMVMHVLSAPADYANDLSESVARARAQVGRCSICGMLDATDPCSICTDARRDATQLCVVERPTGVLAMERSGSFRGRYHVLHGALNPIEGIGPAELGLDALFERIARDGVQEVIVATNATAEGEATAMYLARQLQGTGTAVSRLAHGMPMGGGLEYTDDATLHLALSGRTRL